MTRDILSNEERVAGAVFSVVLRQAYGVRR